MKNLVFAFALLCSTSLVAQFSYNVDENGVSGTGIQSPTNTASGVYSMAMGIETQAIGDNSTAMGYFTTASGNSSTAMGFGTTASGFNTTAMGYGTTAQDYASTAIGTFNETKETPTNQFSLQNTAFVIGNGWLNENNEIDKSNAFEVLFDGTTTIAGNVTAPAFIGDGSQLTNLPTPTVNYSDITNVPLSFNTSSGNGIQSATNTASGTSSIAMGYETVANNEGTTAFGQGSIASGNTATAIGGSTTASGDFSTAMGNRTQAIGDYSTAMGDNTEASGRYSTAMGNFSTASGFSSTAMGWSTEASGGASTAMGYNTQASGNYSTAMGNETYASGDISTAMGYNTQASGSYSTAMGDNTEASGILSTAFGYETTSSGVISTAMGLLTTAEDYSSFTIGSHNKADETPNPENFSYQNTAFVIGNGGFDSSGNYDGHLSNALEVLFDGTTTIAGDLNINSDARLKANIISLGATLSKLLQIDGKTYTMKKDTNHKKKIGLLAQDIEKVFPELVTETNDIKSVNYQGLVPVLINAMKEQDEVIRSQDAINKEQEAKLNKQQQEIDTYKKELDELKTMVKQLMSK